jgi:hypothetical protein
MTVGVSCVPIAALVSDSQPKAVLQLTGASDVDAVELSDLVRLTLLVAAVCGCYSQCKMWWYLSLKSQSMLCGS